MQKKIISALPSTFTSNIYLYYRAFRLITHKNSYLVQTGYINSFRKKLPIDLNSQPLPWMNYSMIDFLAKRLTNNMQIFEYGAGYSSLFFANKVQSVIAVEYDENWYDKIKNFDSDTNNLQILFSPLDINYPYTITHIDSENKFDIVIIDGRKRVKCAQYALPFLKNSGVLILDDSDRPYYSEVFDFYIKEGYKEITIKGLKPAGLGIYSSTIFYKAGNNCLDI